MGDGVVDEIENRAETADVENCFIFRGFVDEALKIIGFLPELFLGGPEIYRDGVGEELDRDGIEDYGVALARSGRNGEVAEENIAWVCEFWETSHLYRIIRKELNNFQK